MDAKVYIEGAAPSSSETPSSSSEAQQSSSSDAQSSSSVGPTSSSDAQSSSSVGPASSSDALSSSNGVVSSSSALALPAEMKVFRMSGSAQVFDMQGKFLGTVELQSGASLKEIVVNKFGKSGMYLLKQGAAVKVVSAEKR